MMRIVKSLCLPLLAALVGCAAPTGPGSPEGAAVSEGDFDLGDKSDGNAVEWRLWDEPVDLVPGEPTEGGIAYGECQQTGSDVSGTETEVNIEITVSCGNAYADVAWFVVPAEVVESHREAGYAAMTLTLGTQSDFPSLRGSIHRASGERRFNSQTRLASAPDLYDGDTLSVPLDAPGELHVFVSRGRAGWLGLWETGTAEFTVNVEMGYEPAASIEP